VPTGGGLQNTNNFLLFSQDVSFFDPANNGNKTALMPSQTDPSSPAVSGLDSASGLILPDRSPSQRTAHFPDDLYDLTPTSHLMRLLSALLGDSGAGQLRKRLAMAQLGQVLTSSHFYDLDGFYGAIFNLNRLPSEDISAAQFNPYVDNTTPDDWNTVQSADASYRERINGLARGVAMGATRPGMLAAAEAVLGDLCDVYEGFSLIDTLGDHTIYLPTDPDGDGQNLIPAGTLSGGLLSRTWLNVETDFANYHALEALTWGGVAPVYSGSSASDVLIRHYADFEVIPLLYDDMENDTYLELQFLDSTPFTHDTVTETGDFVTQDGTFAYMTRYSFLVRPKRHYEMIYPDPVDRASAQAQDEDAIRRVLNVIRPAGSYLTVDVNGVEMHDEVMPSHFAADSEYWDVVAEVHPKPRPGVSCTGTNSDLHLYPISKHQGHRVSPYSGQLMTGCDPHPLPVPAFSNKQDESWDYSANVSAALTYAKAAADLAAQMGASTASSLAALELAEQPTVFDIARNTTEGALTQALTNSQIVNYYNGSQVVYSPDKALIDPKQTAAAKLASPGVQVAGLFSAWRT
jgi:hypothetical protein